jgi:predicted phage terminase large subunit-like protein
MSNPPPQPKPHRAFTEALRGAWRRQARPEQVAPTGPWVTWVFCGGRGAGKTRSGAEWVSERVAGGARFIHLIAPTAADTRDVLLEGPAGLLTVSSSQMRPIYQPSLRKVLWPNGAQALLFSSDEPDRLRGPQADTVWIDELCAMRQAQEVLDNMYFGLRVGRDPRCLITTTPRPLKCFKALLARDGQDVIVTRSSSFANRENLAPAFFSQITAKYAGTRLGRQELEAELLTDTPGALWHMERIEELRVRVAPQPLERIVVAIDPATTHGPDSDETGILVAGLGADGAGYVLDDLSGRYPPEEWARRAIHAYRTHAADRIVAEVNNGGAMVEHTLRSVDPTIPFTAVHASRGKLTRAEPVSALYEQSKVHHVGIFGPLEDQMTSYDGSRTGASPDRLDALVWGLTALMLGEPPGLFIRQESLLRADAAGAGIPGPVEVPDQVERVFAVGAVTEHEPDALGVVFFAVARGLPSVVVVDWDVMPFEQSTLDGFFASVAARLKELGKLGRRSHAPLLIEPSGLGAMLFEQGRLRRYTVQPLVDEELLAKDLNIRVIEVGNYLASGAIKLVRGAFEKNTTHRGNHRNHLVAELAAFSLTEKEKRIGPLLAAFATGALDAFSGRHHLHAWLRLANPTPVEPGPLADIFKTAPPAATAPTLGLSSDPEVCRIAGSFYAGTPAEATANVRRAEAVVQKRRETEALLEREHTVVRAAAAERERKMREAGFE